MAAPSSMKAMQIERFGGTEILREPIVRVPARDESELLVKVDAAGAVPLAALTAWQGLFRQGGLAGGERILVHGGSGGVGHFARQFAKSKGAHVATTVSAAHIGFVRNLGAGQAIDYEKERFEGEVWQVDLVFDLIGGETQERSWALLGKSGRLVSTLTEPSRDKAAAAQSFLEHEHPAGKVVLTLGARA
jgi:NADPH:quinone reductase-like Zn-dependent oxidoreductase